MVLFLTIFYDSRRKRRGSASTKSHLTGARTCMTGKLQKETNQAKINSLSSKMHTSKVRKTNLPTVAITLSKRGAHPLFNLLHFSHNKVAQEKRQVVVSVLVSVLVLVFVFGVRCRCRRRYRCRFLGRSLMTVYDHMTSAMQRVRELICVERSMTKNSSSSRARQMLAPVKKERSWK